MNILRLDTSDNLITKVELEIDGKKFLAEEKREQPRDQNVLELIEKLLHDHKISLQDINSVEIVTGPGSFTGLRVGTAIANALSFGAQVKVNGKPFGEIVTPEYS